MHLKISMKSLGIYSLLFPRYKFKLDASVRTYDETFGGEFHLRRCSAARLHSELGEELHQTHTRL